MKMLIPTAGFFPAQNYGGPPVSILNMCNLFRDDIEFFIVTSNHDLNVKTPLDGVHGDWNYKYGIAVKYISDNEMTYQVFASIVDEISPDIIYLNSFFDARITTPFLKIAKEKNIRVIFAPRGQFNAGAFHKKYKKIPYIFYIRHYLHKVLFQSTCEEETSAIKRWLSIDEQRIKYLPNIPTIPNHQYIHEKKAGELKIVFFSRICEKKNLLFALETLKSVKQGIMHFDIYGPIEEEEYWYKCKKCISEVPTNITIEYKGKINHEDVYETISKYDLFFFPTFSENYGHVIAEALFAGLPILISDQTPWTDVNENGAGKALSLQDKDAFVSYLNTLLSYDAEQYKKISNGAYEYVHKKTNLAAIKKKYEDVFYV